MSKLFLLSPCVLLVATANIMVKARVDRWSAGASFLSLTSLFRLLSDPLFYLAFVLTGFSIAWWLYITPSLDISVLYPALQAGVIVMTVLISALFLDEPLTSQKVLSLLVLLSGIYLLATSYSPNA